MNGLTAEMIAEDIIYYLVLSTSALNSCDIYHRDLKPENVLIWKDGNRWLPMIMDFGLSKHIFPNDTMGKHSNVGTVGLHDHALSGRRYNVTKCDITGIGVILLRFMVAEDDFMDMLRKLKKRKYRFKPSMDKQLNRLATPKAKEMITGCMNG
eukprot:807739_1